MLEQHEQQQLVVRRDGEPAGEAQRQQAENGDLNKAGRCEVCHAPWSINLVSVTKKLQHCPTCWVFELEGDGASLRDLSGRDDFKVLSALKVGSIIVQTPYAAARGGQQTNAAQRAQAGDARALACFSSASPNSGASSSYGASNHLIAAAML